jgi:hypothetical protein
MHTLPQTTTNVTFATALRTLATQAITRYPGEQARIDRGLILALNGHAIPLELGTYSVLSSCDAEVHYCVTRGHCDCPDAPQAPDGRCKHRWAVALVRRAHRLTTYPRIAYHATYKSEHGMAIRDEQGRVWFQGDNDVLVELFDVDRPHLQLHGRLDVSAAARMADGEAGTDLAQLDARRLDAAITEV